MLIENICDFESRLLSEMPWHSMEDVCGLTVVFLLSERGSQTSDFEFHAH